MKILRRNDDFKKMPERNMDDVLVINNLIKQGWNYCSKSAYRDFFKANEDLKKPEIKLETVKKKGEKGEKEVKVQNKPEKKKIVKKTKADKKKAKK